MSTCGVLTCGNVPNSGAVTPAAPSSPACPTVRREHVQRPLDAPDRALSVFSAVGGLDGTVVDAHDAVQVAGRDLTGGADRLERRVDVRAGFEGVGTPGPEPAPRRDGGRRRHVPPEHDPLP